MAKSREKILARQLRKRGQSIKEIAKTLKVSPGSVSIWCNDIQLSEDQIKILEARMKDPYYGKRAIYLNRIKKQTAEKISNLKAQGNKEIGKLTYRELFIAGVALYWAEGFKKDKQMGFANVDPKMIVVFLSWLSRCLKIPKKDINLRLTVNQDYVNKIIEMEDYWAKVTGISRANFQKPIIQKVKWKKEYENKDEYKGVLRIRVHKSLSLLRKTLGSIEGLYLNSLDST